MAGNVVKSSFIGLVFKRRFIHTDVFCIPSRLLVAAKLSFALCTFGCSFFYRSFGFTEFENNGNGKEYNDCVRVFYISLPFFAKQQYGMTTFIPIFKISFSNFDAVAHILFKISLTRSDGYKQTE